MREIKLGKTIMDPKKSTPKKEPLDDHGIHMPDRSWYPLLTGLGFLGLVLGMLFHQSVDVKYR
jgi:hypothetical protein